MENSQLPRMSSTTVPPASSIRSEQNPVQGEAGEFDNYLHQQIEQHSAPAQVSGEKTELNHEDSPVSVIEEVLAGESEDTTAVTEVLNVEAVTSELEPGLEAALMATAQVQEQAQPTMALASESSIKADGNEQLMPPTGNGLPLMATTEVATSDELMGVPPSRQAQVAINLASVIRQGIPSDTVSSQPKDVEGLQLADVLKESVLPAVQSKPNLMADPSSQTGLPKAGIAMTSAITAASLQQQVPLTTTAAAVNMVVTTLPTEPGINTLTSMTGSIGTPVQSSSWSQGVTEQVAYMVQGRFQSAELRLNPANLGPLQIKMNLQDDQASVTFISAHAPVREAVDAALPRLREMFEQQGLNLADVDVSQYSEGQGDQAEPGQDDGMMTAASTMEADESQSVVHRSQVTVAVEDGVSIYA
jgi:flagellar hook-length control protein FliK